MRAFVDGLINNDEREEGKNHTLVMTKMAKKQLPFRAAQTYLPHKNPHQELSLPHWASTNGQLPRKVLSLQ